MSQTHILPSINGPSPPLSHDDVDTTNVISTIENNEILSAASMDTFSNSNDSKVISNDDAWANFGGNQNSETILPVAASDVIEEDWANFESNAIPSTECSVKLTNDTQMEKINKDEDVFGDYGEVQVTPKCEASSLSINCLTTEQIESLISTCFPLEPSTDNDNFISSELPCFTTFNDQKTKQLACFQPSLSLWNVLSNISNDPLGIKYQWRKSYSERLFHQALGVSERVRIKTVSTTPPEILKSEKVQIPISNMDNENKLLPSSHIDGTPNGLENPLADIDSPSLSANSRKNEDNISDIQKPLDLDSSVPSIKLPTLNKEEQISSSTIVHRNASPILPQRSTPIKTIDLFPGSTTILNDDVKPVIDSIPNFRFMNAKALMSPIQLNVNNNHNEPTTLY